MENASKALLIAGAVLATILIISLAIFIVNSTSESWNSSKNTMTELEIYTFNHKFTMYEGKNKSKSDVIQLLKTVASHNSANDTKVAVKVTDVRSAYVYDSCKYVIIDDETNALIKCNSSNVVPLDQIIDIVNKNPYTYTVTLYYCNRKTQSISNNRDLNPAFGCVILVDISRNY